MRQILIFICLSSLSLFSQEIEEIIITGTLKDSISKDSISSDIIDNNFLKSINITTFSEISKYLASSSGSRFQSNSLDGVDQGMSNINLRGLDNTSTLLLINSGLSLIHI